MRRVRGWLAMSFFMCVAAGLAARADDGKEEKVPLDKVPKPALKAVKDKFRDAELVSAQTEKENGKVVYEINLKHRGQKIEATVTSNGKIVSIEKTLAARDLPRPVAEAINSKYAKARFQRVEEVTEGDKTSYKVAIVTAVEKPIEIVLEPNGKIVKEEKADKGEKKEKKKDKK
ncbi:MAG: PepSY domain-containing protein [Gemmataceae bacterium]